MRMTVLFGFCCLITACAASPGNGDVEQPRGSTSAPSAAPSGAPVAPASAAAAPSGAPSAAASTAEADAPLPDFPAPGPAPAPAPVSVRDPKIVKLAKAAAACKFEEGEIDRDCKALT